MSRRPIAARIWHGAPPKGREPACDLCSTWKAGGHRQPVARVVELAIGGTVKLCREHSDRLEQIVRASRRHEATA
jgi:hypothetical protein